MPLRIRILNRLIAASLLAGAALPLCAQQTPPSVAAHTAQQRRWDALQAQLAQLQQQLAQLAEDNRALREQQQQLERQVAQLAAGAPAVTPAHGTAPAAAVSTALPAGGTAQPPAGSALPGEPAQSAATMAAASGSVVGLRLWGYGEAYYSHPTRQSERTEADLARAVFGIGYAFDERTEFNSEYEVEHAVSSASDAGEFEVEQFYVDRRVNEALSARAGLFLMPFGFINEHHEPTEFFGMQRNFVETLIIPSTWREGGIAVHGSTQSGLAWNLGLTTGFNLSRWDFQPQFPLYRTALDLGNGDAGPLRATHQELSVANAHDLSQYLALSYYGMPGLTVGGAVFTGNAVRAAGSAGAPVAGSQRVTLWEGHARWTPGPWDLSALYARGTIGNTAPANAAHAGSPNPLPAAFDGYFLQGAYSLWERGDYRLAPFARFECYNLGARYAGTAGPDLPRSPVLLSATAGDYGLWPQNHDRVWTAGANFYVGPHLVIKGDYQWFQVNQDLRRFDLGLGVAF